MIKEHERVILAVDLPAERLCAGDIGTIIHIHQGGAGYTVEFITLDGETLAVVTLRADQIKPIHKHQVANARDLANA